MNILLTRKAMLARIRKLENQVLDLEYEIANAAELASERETEKNKLARVLGDARAEAARYYAECVVQNTWLVTLFCLVVGQDARHDTWINAPEYQLMYDAIKRLLK
jgi:hypothetical protein